MTPEVPSRKSHDVNRTPIVAGVTIGPETLVLATLIFALLIGRRRLSERSKADSHIDVEQEQEEETPHDKAQLHGDSLIRYELPSEGFPDPPYEMSASHVRATEMLGSERLATEMLGSERLLTKMQTSENLIAEVPGSQILETEMPTREPVGVELTPLSDIADTTRPTSHRQ